MSHINKIGTTNQGPGKGDGRFVVYSQQFNELVDALDDGEVNVETGIIASTTSTQAGATALTAAYNVIGTCATAGDSVRLPAAVAGLKIVIMNHGAASADVFPASADAIDDLGADIAFPLPVEGTLELIATSASQWQSMNQAASAQGEITTTTDTLTEAQSGYTIFLNSATGYVTTLPAPALGLKYKFVCSTQPTSGNHTVVTASSANIIIGSVNDITGDTNADESATAADTISFVASTAVVGDWVEVVSDGTSWFVMGQSVADGGITLTQAS